MLRALQEGREGRGGERGEGRGGARCTGEAAGDWQRNSEQEPAFKVSLQQQQDLVRGRRCGGHAQGWGTAQLPAEMKSILSGL